MGCDLVTFEVSKLLKSFLLTHPVWDVTHLRRENRWLDIISTYTSRVGCDAINVVNLSHTIISTHTSRVGCDDASEPVTFCSAISTHTSRVGCDSIPLCLHSSGTFLLTHPVWDVTITGLNGLTFILFLLTHPVWDVTRSYLHCRNRSC